MLTDMSKFDATQALALDYESLRQQGITWLEKLVGSEWTDFNEHDPGITILEQLCYTLTDLAYRIDFSLPDLLSEGGANPYASLHAPTLILSSRPVTLVDMRKLVIDVEGVQNAWIEEVAETEPSKPVIYFQKQGLPRMDQPANLGDAKNLIHFVKTSNATTIKLDGGFAIQLKGLFRVLIEKSPSLDDNKIGEIIKKVAARLHAHRGLAIDFQSIEVLKTQQIRINATIEITPQGNPDDIYLAILHKIADSLSPSVPFYTLAQRLAANKTIEEIFDGPRLNQGFIDSEQLAGLERKTSLRTSDLIHTIMDVEGVRLVKYLVFIIDDGKKEPWVLNLDSDSVPMLDLLISGQTNPQSTKLTLEKNQLPISINTDTLNERFKNARTLSAYRKSSPDAQELSLPSGRDRQVGRRYYSIQHQFPANYGIGAFGLSATASEERLARAQQLKAYLLLFDQLLANSFAQLAHIGDLFGFDGSLPSTYFAGSIDDSTLGLGKLWHEKDADVRNEHLQKLVKNLEADDEHDLLRKNRFLDHLLARFAEPFTDYARFQTDNLTSSEALAKLARDKAAILRHYPEISGGRGTAYDVTQAWSNDNRAGLEQRLRLKLGMTGSEQLYLIEHILLRPIDDDETQKAPLLADAHFDDPYSLQITLVFAGNSPRFKDAGFKQFVEQTVREETPAHLIVYVRWLVDDPTIAGFKDAYKNWLNQQSNYRYDPNQSDLRESNPLELQLIIQLIKIRLRDARDCVIDRLGIGHTYPLADLPISETVTVAFNTPAVIHILYSQEGVIYQLCDETKKPIEPEIKANGNGGELTLTTPSINEDCTFTIKATKSHGGKALTVILIQPVAVKVGLDTQLTAQINAPLLDTNSDARIVNYGETVEVEILLSQQGVDYSLVDAKSGNTISFSVVRGNLATITLSIVKVTEDIHIKIFAIKIFDESLRRDKETAWLDTVLSLKVRANPALEVSLESAILDYDTNAIIKIKNSQTSVFYRVFVRAIADNEFIRLIRRKLIPIPLKPLIVEVPDKPNVQIIPPSWQIIWNPPAGFNALGEAIQGNGAELTLNLNNLKTDQLVIIQARKNHDIKNPTDGTTVPSEIQLKQAAAVLVKPNPNPLLQLRASIENDELKSPIQVLGGQRGVFYYFSKLADGGELGQAVYFHQQDSTDASKNKGIQDDDKNNIALEIGVDFAIAAPLPPTKTDSAIFPPEPPELDVSSLAVDTSTLSIRAVKAQTGLEVTFQRTVDKLLKQPDPPLN